MKHKILILESQHGNEYSGERLHNHIEHHHPNLLSNITFLVANPRARRQKKRYTESDMNRSYTGNKDTYEERRAVKILKTITEGHYDLVLDMHTTPTDQAPCLIMASVNAKNIGFLQASSFSNIVTINNAIVNNSINGALPHAISVEINNQITDEVLELICEDIDRFLRGQISDNQKYVYEVTELLDKSDITEVEAKKLRNFSKSKFGYYPIMVGENSYQDFTNYLGFKAYNRYEFK